MLEKAREGFVASLESGNEHKTPEEIADDKAVEETLASSLMVLAPSRDQGGTLHEEQMPGVETVRTNTNTLGGATNCVLSERLFVCCSCSGGLARTFRRPWRKGAM